MDTPAITAPVEERSSGALTLLLLAVAAVVAVVFAFNSSLLVPNHWYGLFKFVHVLFAVIWIGGGLMITILAVRAERQKDPGELATIARQAAFMGERIFAPAGLVVLLMGIAMMSNTDWGWGKFWIVAGLVGYATTFVTGIAVLSPLAKKINKLVEEHGPAAPQTQDMIRRILLIARIDMTVLVLVIADMVTKPYS
jgi:uncharacterized membrane protein